MTQAESLHVEASSSPLANLMSHVVPTILFVTSCLLFVTVLAVTPKDEAISRNLFIVIAGVLGIVAAVHVRFLVRVHSQQKRVFRELDATTQEMQHTEKQLRANRALAHSASAEAEALRATTLTLTRNWQLDHVLDTVLECLAELFSFERATVLLLEDNSRLFVAGESGRSKQTPTITEFPSTFDVAGFPLLKRTLREQSPVVLADVAKEPQWRPLFSGFDTRSWLCLPLVAADGTLGLLCADHSKANAFTSKNLRLARSLAASLAAAIQNARLYEQAQIYGTELEKRLSDLRRTQTALEQAEEQRMISEENFHAVFRSSPVAFSITTFEEGRFLDVNRAFEQRYGFSRHELLRSTSFELNIWEDRRDRAFMISQLNNGPVRNLVTRLRTKAGQLRLTAYSASKIRFEGKSCVLGVSGDLPNFENTDVN